MTTDLVTGQLSVDNQKVGRTGQGKTDLFQVLYASTFVCLNRLEDACMHVYCRRKAGPTRGEIPRSFIFLLRHLGCSVNKTSKVTKWLLTYGK